MPYDMLTHSEQEWLRKHVTGPVGRVIRGVPNLGRGCSKKRRKGYQLFEGSGNKMIECLARALETYFQDYQPIKICRYNVKSEAGGWYIEYLESTQILSITVVEEEDEHTESVGGVDPIRVLEHATGIPAGKARLLSDLPFYDFDFYVNDIRESGFVGGGYSYAPPGLYIETFDVPVEVGGDRRNTKHIRTYIVPIDFNIEQIIEKKNWYFIQLHNEYRAREEELIKSRLGIGDPWKSKPQVSEKFCEECIMFQRKMDHMFPGITPFKCPAGYQPWNLECKNVKRYLGQKKR